MNQKKIIYNLVILVFITLGFSNCSVFRKTTIKEGDTKLPKLTLLNHQKIMEQLLGEPKIDIKNIGILVYDGCYTMEAIGAMAVFSEMNNVKIHYISAEQTGWVQTDATPIFVEKTTADFDALDLLIVPGGNQKGMSKMLQNEKIKSWIQKVEPTTKLTAGIGYGSLILGKAGILKGKKIALDWYEAKKNSQLIGAEWIDKRYNQDGKYWTSVSQTAALDLGLAMLLEISSKNHVQGAMLDLEYDPHPPLKGGTKMLSPNNVLSISEANSYSTIDGFKLLNDTKANPSANHLFSATANKVKNIAILAYDGFFTLDAIGPLVVLSQVPGVQVHLVGKATGKLKTGRTYLQVEKTIYDDDQWDMILIPGGAVNTYKASQDTAILKWINNQDKHTKVTASVCTGSWVLGNAGLLKGKKATSHWYRTEERMQYYGAQYVKERYTNDGKYWTSAGVSAGIDVSYALMQNWLGNDFTYYSMLQLAYHPQPPIEGGRPDNSNPLVFDMMMQMYDYGMLPLFKKEKNKDANTVETDDAMQKMHHH